MSTVTSQRPIIKGVLRTINVGIQRYFLGYTRDEDRKKILRSFLKRKLYTCIRTSQYINSGGPIDIQDYCDRYNECKMVGVYETVKRWINDLLQGLRRPGWSPGHYPPTAPAPPIEAIGALGEGVAGYIMENHFNFRLLYRPVRSSPDAILLRQDPYEIGLMEVKTTVKFPWNISKIPRLTNNLTKIILDGAMTLIDFWAKIYHITGNIPYAAYSIGVAIKNIICENINQEVLLVEVGVMRLELQ
mgnify:CR=1 FL=1